jgi:hypothetical protein
MTKTIAAGALALFVVAASLRAASPDSTALGQAKPCAHTVESGRPADLGVRGRSAEIEVEFTLEPGGPVADWTTANQAAREKGERRPDTLTVARLVVVWADGREFVTNIRYNESVGAAVRDWWNPEDGFIYHLAFADVTAAEPLEEGGLQYRCAYRLRWPNPRPEMEIQVFSAGWHAYAAAKTALGATDTGGMR